MDVVKSVHLLAITCCPHPHSCPRPRPRISTTLSPSSSSIYFLYSFAAFRLCYNSCVWNGFGCNNKLHNYNNNNSGGFLCKLRPSLQRSSGADAANSRGSASLFDYQSSPSSVKLAAAKDLSGQCSLIRLTDAGWQSSVWGPPAFLAVALSLLLATRRGIGGPITLPALGLVLISLLIARHFFQLRMMGLEAPTSHSEAAPAIFKFIQKWDPQVFQIMFSRLRSVPEILRDCIKKFSIQRKDKVTFELFAVRDDINTEDTSTATTAYDLSNFQKYLRSLGFKSVLRKDEGSKGLVTSGAAEIVIVKDSSTCNSDTSSVSEKNSRHSFVVIFPSDAAEAVHLHSGNIFPITIQSQEEIRIQGSCVYKEEMLIAGFCSFLQSRLNSASWLSSNRTTGNHIFCKGIGVGGVNLILSKSCDTAALLGGRRDLGCKLIGPLDGMAEDRILEVPTTHLKVLSDDLLTGTFTSKREEKTNSIRPGQVTNRTGSPTFESGDESEFLGEQNKRLFGSLDRAQTQAIEDTSYKKAVERNHNFERKRRKSKEALPQSEKDSPLYETDKSETNLNSNFSFNSQSTEGRIDPSYTENYAGTKERNLPVPKSNTSEEEKSNCLLEEGEALLDEGQEGLTGRIEVGVAERMLYEAANIFAAAAAMDPSSLSAIGSWGNTLLVHGQLKFKLSQQLRSMLPLSAEGDITGNRRQLEAEEDWSEQMEFEVLDRTLQEVCEECEKLLVEAGRKYRLALSLDRRDARALYNWGLALCFRAQLTAEERTETTTQDADKIYLAAIDKFEALMSTDQTYAPGALLNWGLAMRDRSRLKPMGDKDRVKLLFQAKELFQDALKFDPHYGQARGAIAACNAELRGLQEYGKYANQRERLSRSRKPWWNFFVTFLF
ncbi:hypothetical protein O6H91_10G077000 [Diphasiastrum complanatum]|uniref:Uncharacterized protein n=1 Tax=Diphasiastrum complanatum TaxID=34168 RepID=A0ACC2CIK3_DIPCM|nr:hypothetical protein O6H91_10G077000 [Diphasiastrum complanatum]